MTRDGRVDAFHMATGWREDADAAEEQAVTYRRREGSGQAKEVARQTNGHRPATLPDRGWFDRLTIVLVDKQSCLTLDYIMNFYFLLNIQSLESLSRSSSRRYRGTRTPCYSCTRTYKTAYEDTA